MTHVRHYAEGRAGRITLTRPEALNALSHRMCLEIEAALDGFVADPAVEVIVLDGAGDKAFCAGGDVAHIVRAALGGDVETGRAFWRDEYRLNAKIARCPKPVVALMHGFTLGGGVGLGGHASHRVVCETSQVAMPETGIGLAPDTGGTLLLARAPGRIGEYLGTTGGRMGPGDAIHAGFADHFVPREFWIDLVTGLEARGAAALTAEMAETPPDSPLAAMQGWIDETFAGTLPEALARLEADGREDAARTLATLRRVSPLAAALTHATVRAARDLDEIGAVLALEYRTTARACEMGDFNEGVRALLIDKDKAPRWQHARIEDVPAEAVAAMMAPLGAGEMTF